MLSYWANFRQLRKVLPEKVFEPTMEASNMGLYPTNRDALTFAMNIQANDEYNMDVT